MFRLYNVTGSVKMEIIGIEVKAKFSSNGSFVGGANAVTERCAERENGKTSRILILVKQGKLTFLEFIKLNAV